MSIIIKRLKIMKIHPVSNRHRQIYHNKNVLWAIITLLLLIII